MRYTIRNGYNIKFALLERCSISPKLWIVNKPGPLSWGISWASIGMFHLFHEKKHKYICSLSLSIMCCWPMLRFAVRFCSSAIIYRVWIHAGSRLSKVIPNLNFKTQDITGSFNTVADSILWTSQLGSIKSVRFIDAHV